MRPSLYWCLYEEEFEDNKGVIRICKSKKDRPHKGVIRICKSKKDRPHKGVIRIRK